MCGPQSGCCCGCSGWWEAVVFLLYEGQRRRRPRFTVCLAPRSGFAPSSLLSSLSVRGAEGGGIEPAKGLWMGEKEAGSEK